MVCEHLSALEKALLDCGASVTFRGAAWSRNCREWVYFDLYLDVEAIRRHFPLPACVEIHENTDPKSGTERGLVCRECNDAVMGSLERGERLFPAPDWRPGKHPDQGGFDLDALKRL